MNWNRYEIPVVVGLLALVPLIFFQEGLTYIMRLCVLMLIFALLAMALNIVFGHTDQLLLFVGALTGVGAYTTALTAESLGVTPWLTLIPGAIVVGLIGLLVCYVAARRQFTVIVIAILTLALQFAFVQIFVGARDITGGSTGFRFTGLELEVVQDALGLHPYVVLYYLLLIVLAAVFVLYRRMMNSKYGIAFEAIRQDEVAAEAAGIDVVKYKSIAGFVSTFIIGFVGPFYAQVDGYVLPGMFEFRTIDVLVLIVLVIGGMRTMFGPVVGAGLMIYINEELQQFGQWRTVIFGALLIVLFLYFREGIVPYVEDLLEERFKFSKRIAELRSG